MTELNIGLDTVVKYLESVPGLEPGKELSPNTKLSNEQYEALKKRFLGDKRIKEKADSIFPLTSREQKPSIHITDGKGIDVKVVGKIDLDSINQKSRPKKKTKEEKEAERRAKREEWLAKTRSNPIDEDNNPGYNNNHVIDEEPQREQKITLSQLRFEDDHISFTKGNETYVYKYSGFSFELNRHKNNSLIKGKTTTIILDNSNHTFRFTDSNTLIFLEDFKDKIDNENFEKHLQEIEKKTNDKVVYYVAFDKLIFSQGRVTVKFKKRKYVYLNNNIREFDRVIHRIQNHYFQIGTYFQFDNVKLLLDIEKGTFVFQDIDICEYVKRLQEKHLSKKDSIDGHKDVSVVEKKPKPKIEHRIQFNAIRFSRSLASIIYKKQRYIYRDYNIKEYDRILGQVYSRVSKARMNAIKTSLVWVIIDTETETFTFKDIDINKYVNNLKESFLPESKKVENRIEKKIVPQKPSSATKTMTLGAGNIRFYNDYFLIFQTKDGQIDNSVAPYRVNDPDSHEILNLVHNYFEQRFEQMRIVVKHDGTKILEPSRLDIFQLKNYVRALRRNLEVKGEWWEEVQNARKRSFAQCFGESRDSVKSKYVKSKNEYLYNLSSLQNEKKLIRVYEINHGKEEDAFIFTIDMSGNRNAIIFENASNDASTTTWVFVTRNENYEACVNLIFDYFTDYTISSKRSSLRAKDVNPPEKFKADSYAFIDHDDLEQWLKKLNKILENKPQPSEIRFVPGLNIPQSSETRTSSGNAITTSNLHNQLMLKLYDRLCSESGKENVGTEIRVGTKRIDAVVKGKGFYDIYEVKTASNSFDCVTEALGQICQYAYLYCRDNIGKMVIVGAPAASSEVEQYLSWFRKKHSMEVYYMQVPLF